MYSRPRHGARGEMYSVARSRRVVGPSQPLAPVGPMVLWRWLGRAALLAAGCGAPAPAPGAGAGPRRLQTGCIDVAADRCSDLAGGDRLGCDNELVTWNATDATYVREVCAATCVGCPCRNAYDEGNGQPGNGSAVGESPPVSACNTLIAGGVYSCGAHFCATCDFAGLCDLTCDFCKDGDEPSVVCTNPYDDFQGPGACDARISSGLMTCEDDFCEGCSYSGFCRLSCGGCQSGVAAATIGSPAFESRSAPGTGQHNSSSAAEIKAYETWCLWFGSGVSDTESLCAHPLMWVAILPMTGALCGLCIGCCVGIKCPHRMRKRGRGDIVGIGEPQSELAGAERLSSGDAAGETTAAATQAQHRQGDGRSGADKTRRSSRRASLASSASSSSVFTQSSSKVKSSRTRKWVQQNTANPLASGPESELSLADAAPSGTGRRSGVRLRRPEHAFDLETPPPSPPSEPQFGAGERGGNVGAELADVYEVDGDTPPLQLSADDFLAVIDEMTDEEVVESCRELGLLTRVRDPRQHQLRQALRTHYAGDGAAAAAAAPVAPPPPGPPPADAWPAGAQEAPAPRSSQWVL